METPLWLQDLGPHAMRMRFSASTLLRARELLDHGRVWDLGIRGDTLLATVRDLGTLYRVGVSANGARLESTCRCPEGRRCAHTAATVLAHQRSLEANAPSAWQEKLESILTAAGEDSPSEPATSHTQLSLPSGDEQGIRLGIRIERSRGSWVFLRVLANDGTGWSTNAISWGKIGESAKEFRPDHVAALRAIMRTRVHSHHQLLSTIEFSELSPAVWPALSQACRSGVELLDPAGNPVRLQEFDSQLTLTPHDGGVRLAATVTGVEAEAGIPVCLIGSPVHGALIENEHWVIGGFHAGLTALNQRVLSLTSPIDVPRDEIMKFTRYLPTLQHRSELIIDSELVLPELPQMCLVMRFTPSGDATHPVQAHTLIDYGQPLGMVDPNTSSAPWRDRLAEQRLLSKIPESFPAAGILKPSQFDEIARWAEHSEDVILDYQEGITSPQHMNEPPQIQISVDQATDWFDLTVLVVLGEVQVPLGELIAALAAGADELLLANGVWFQLDHPELHQLRQLLSEAEALTSSTPGVLRIGVEHVSIFEELAALGIVTRQCESWRRHVMDLMGDPGGRPIDPPSTLKATLRSYQVEGYSWLMRHWQSRVGGILADEMGLGKTMQALALLTGLKESGAATEPALVIAPASVLATWEAEAAKFAPQLRVVVLTDTSRRRGSALATEIVDADLVVTSYTLLRLEAEAYAELRFSTVLLDEAQFVKNRQSVTYKAVRTLLAHVKFAMTGTPLENSLLDLWSIVSITSPGLFPDPRRFDDLYRKPVEAGDTRPLERLLRRVKPLMLRRTKDQVASDLPPKQEQVVQVELSAEHRQLYEKHLTQVRREVLGLVDDVAANRFAILRSLTRLRQLSLSPQLIEPGSTLDSAKIDALIDMVGEIVAKGHRALVFSSFTTFLAMVRDRLTEAGYTSVYLDGTTRDRASRIQQFRTGNDPLFLISLKAGGFGLTLTEADYVFILDPWWNPAAEAQAVDRTHRIGQERHVFVYRLVAHDTIENKVLTLQEHKRELFDAVVGGSDVGSALDANDVRGLLDLD